MITIFVLIFLTSFFLAWRSMADYSLANEVTEKVKKRLSKKSIQGRIIFLKNKIKHYTIFK